MWTGYKGIMHNPTDFCDVSASFVALAARMFYNYNMKVKNYFDSEDCELCKRISIRRDKKLAQ